jgi:TonB family protein
MVLAQYPEYLLARIDGKPGPRVSRVLGYTVTAGGRLGRSIRMLCLLSSVTMTGFAADVNSLLSAARTAQSARNLAAAEDSYSAAFELAISQEMKRLSPVAVEVSTFFSQQQQPEKAEAVLKRALDAEDAAGQTLVTEIPVLMQLGVMYQRRSVDLASVQVRLVKAWEGLAGPESVVVANNLYNLGGTLEQTGKFAEAEQAIQRDIAILEKTYGANAPSVGLALVRLASIETRLGKDDLAKESRDHESAIRQTYSTQDAVTRVGGGVLAPRVISSREPPYSEDARKAKIQGSVMLSLNVDTNGEPADITVLLPLGYGLDEKAVEAVKAWRFQPATKGGQPVRIQTTIQVSFRLL